MQAIAEVYRALSSVPRILVLSMVAATLCMVSDLEIEIK